ncbi:unnamed protein product [Paramecium pentaurelia]|uniref:Transmembrane protein n=1 Tax=Paramecium pentaurelia TaxID=43138 RepID=A0A8S1TIM2_9CILI|nr:unnamed protein product [Paramecium pentaurelia]
MDDIKTMIIQQAQQKVNYYQKLNQDSSFNLNNILQITRDTCNQIIQTNKILKSKFSDYPCLSIQNAICYYESEITNNYYEARKVSNQTSMSDEKFLMFNSSLISNKDKIGYLLIEISNDFQQTEIKFASNQFQKLFERKNYDQKLQLDDLLPKFLIKQHPTFIQNFLTTGHSKFFQNFQLNFLNTNDGLIKGVGMCYDLTKIEKQQDQLIFAVFFQELSDSKAYVLVDGITKYSYFSECFLKKLGFQEHEIKFIKSSNILSNLSISYLLPDYDTLIDINEQEIRLQGVDLYFANIFRLFSTIFTEKKVQNSQNTFTKIAWHRKDKLFKYSVNLQITRRQFNELYYIIIEILSIEANSQTNIIDSINRIECQNYLQKNECSISEESESYSSGQINLQYQDVPNKVEIFQGLKNEFILSHHQLDSLSQPRITICEPGRIVTPNESSSDTKRKFHSRNQQQFYSQKLSQADIQALISEKKLDIPYDDEQQQQLKMDQLSDKSSIEDEQKKKFMKKFELVQKLMVYKRPLKLIEILSLLTLQNIIFTIFSLIAITVMFNDLSQVLKEIDTISLHSSIMVKHDIFFSIRATIKIYQEYQKKKVLLNVTNLISPFYNNLAESYLDYQNDLYNQFQNLNLQPYLDDYYLIIYQLESLSNQQLQEKNVTVREALMINLQYEFAVLDAFLNQKDISNSTFQVFLFTNFVKLHQYLEDLTKNLLSESTNRSLSVASKWMVIWIFFQIGALVLAIFNFYCYYNYITFYDKFLLALKFIDSELIAQEIERYKEMIKKLKDNSRHVFEYKIDLDQIQQSKTNKRQLSIKNKEIINKKVIKLRRFSSFMLIFVLNLIFGGYSAIINQRTQIYLNKYEKTANLFKLFQDLSLSGGNCFLYKEILLGFNNYTFYFQEDRGNMYKMLYNSLDSIQQYLNLSNTLDFNTYLATDSFIILFNDLKTNSLCQYFTQEYLYPYCQLSFDGVLSSGLVSSLNYIQNTIKTQQAINNFTFKTDYNLYEQEGSQIITRAFLNMSLTFKEDLTSLTQNQTDLAYNLSIAFFIYSFIVTFCLLFYLKYHLTNEYYIIRRIISLIPINVLMFDETLDRYLREIALHQELL